MTFLQVNPETVKPSTSQNCNYIPPIEPQPDKWGISVHSLLKNWKWILPLFLIILAVVIARLRGATWEQISLGFLRETSRIPIPEKPKKSKSKK